MIGRYPQAVTPPCNRRLSDLSTPGLRRGELQMCSARRSAPAKAYRIPGPLHLATKLQIAAKDSTPGVLLRAEIHEVRCATESTRSPTRGQRPHRRDA